MALIFKLVLESCCYYYREKGKPLYKEFRVVNSLLYGLFDKTNRECIAKMNEILSKYNGLNIMQIATRYLLFVKAKKNIWNIFKK